MYDKLKHVHVEEQLIDGHWEIYCTLNGLTLQVKAPQKVGRIQIYQTIADIADGKIREIMKGIGHGRH